MWCELEVQYSPVTICFRFHIHILIQLSLLIKDNSESCYVVHMTMLSNFQIWFYVNVYTIGLCVILDKLIIEIISSL